MPLRSPFSRLLLAADLQECASGGRPPWPWRLWDLGGSSASSCPPPPSAAEVPLQSLLPSLPPLLPRCLVLPLLSCHVPIKSLVLLSRLGFCRSLPWSWSPKNALDSWNCLILGWPKLRVRCHPPLKTPDYSGVLRGTDRAFLVLSFSCT